MGFVIHLTGEDAPMQTGDRATYTFNDAGLLVIHDGAIRITLAHGAWSRIEEGMQDKR
ncbi:MAG: hypothetical protein M3400_04730 [Actinomycetota bacterium]|nr:hypothetical protein [Actinomycetota bacterium]